MAALALLFGLFLLVVLGLIALGAILAASQGLNLALEADKTLAILSVLFVFPCVIYGAVYWLNGTNLPQKFMDDLREKQRKDSGEAEHQPDEHQPDIDISVGKAGGDNHDNVDHRLTAPPAEKK